MHESGLDSKGKNGGKIARKRTIRGERETDRQTDRQTDRERERETDRQTDRKRETERQTDKENLPSSQICGISVYKNIKNIVQYKNFKKYIYFFKRHEMVSV